MKTLPLAFLFSLLGLAAATAAPSLRGEITVTAKIVTVGDMFDNAGALSEAALFLAPAPGTSGLVALDDVRRAALKIGLDDFDNVGFTRVRVARASLLVDGVLLGDLIAADLKRRGIVSDGMEASTRFDRADISFNAEAVEQPASLVTLRYLPESGAFAARFMIAGIDQPVDLTGTLELLVPAWRLVANKPAGAILTEADFGTAMVPARIADAGGFADLDMLIGKELLRQSRAGMMLKATDVSEPNVVKRNALVTVFLRTGTMTLTVQSQALGNAAAGEAVDVLNANTKKVLHGVARPDGSVEIYSGLTVAAL